MSSWWDIFANVGWLTSPAVVVSIAIVAIFATIILTIVGYVDWYETGFEKMHLLLFPSPAVLWGLVSLIVFCCQFQPGAWIPEPR